MNMRRIGAVVLRQYYLLRGSPTRVFPLFAWIVIDIVMWGILSRWLDGVAAPGLHFVASLLGAVLLWDFLTRVMQGVTIAFFEDVWTRNFMGVFGSPLSTAEYVTGLVVTGVLTSLVGLAAMFATASLAFGFSFAVFGIVVAPALIALFLTGVALGVIGCAVVLRLGPAAEWLIWPLPAVIAPFAGVYYPLSALPEPMRAIAAILPPAHVFESLRSVAQGGAPDYPDMAIGVGLAIAAVLASAFVFAHVQAHCVKSGLLARYAAETTG